MSLLDCDTTASTTAPMFDADRRQFHRLPMRVPASICLGKGPWHDSALTKNLSAGGALIELPAELAEEYGAGDPIGFEVHIPAGEGVWPEPMSGTADAVVVRSSGAGTDSNRAEHARLVALRFVDRIRFNLD